MKEFDYWDQLYKDQRLFNFSGNPEGLLWLKLKSIIRKEYVYDFIALNYPHTVKMPISKQFKMLFDLMVTDIEHSTSLLDSYSISRDSANRESMDIEKKVSELYQLQNFHWGGDYNNSLDKYLIRHYVKNFHTYDELIKIIPTEISSVVTGYLLNSWYNHWSSIIIEYIFKAHTRVIPTVGQIKGIDFFIDNVPFDLKVTYLPTEYIKGIRKKLSLPQEINYLKKEAKSIGITFNQGAANSIYYEIIEKLKNRNNDQAKAILKKVSEDQRAVLEHAVNNPEELTIWLYENQGEMRFGSENRIYILLYDLIDPLASWKLKRNMDLLGPKINKFLNSFDSRNLERYKIEFEYQGKNGSYQSYSDIIFVINE